MDIINDVFVVGGLLAGMVENPLLVTEVVEIVGKTKGSVASCRLRSDMNPVSFSS